MIYKLAGIYAAKAGWIRFLGDNWLASMLLMLTTCLLIPTLYKRFNISRRILTRPPIAVSSASPSGPPQVSLFNLWNIFAYFFGHLSNSTTPDSVISSALSSKSQQTTSSPHKKRMRYQNRSRRPRPKKHQAGVSGPQAFHARSKQYYDAFLVLDIEGTCGLGTDFNYPNEIIEFPVTILEWRDRTEDGLGSVLEVVDEFRSFVKPTWRPRLSDFCRQLTGITQAQVDSSPHFPEVLELLEAFLVKNGLIEHGTRQRLKRFCWCSDGPFDIRDFVVKQCYISQVGMPPWLQNDILDVRSTVLQYLSSLPPSLPNAQGGITRRSLNIAAQLQVLDLPEFQGRQHSGIDDTRNVARVLTELARRGMCLLPNTTVHPGKRWAWMGRNGEVLESDLPCT